MLYFSVLSGTGQNLQFSSVLKTDSGDYVCFAENVAGLTTASLTLDVQCKYTPVCLFVSKYDCREVCRTSKNRSLV